MSVSLTTPRTAEDLCERFGPPEDLAVKHKLPYLDEAGSASLLSVRLSLSPRPMQGRCDASPKATRLGFSISLTSAPCTS